LGGGRARLLAVIDAPRCPEFLTEIAGVYSMTRLQKVLSVVVLVCIAGIGVAVLLNQDAGARAFGIALGVAGTVGTIDGWSMRVVISPSAVSRTSWIPFFDFSASAGAIHRIRVMEKGSLFLSIDYDGSKRRSASLASANRALILRAAGAPEDPLLARNARSLMSGAVAGAGIGFVGALIAGPVYSEVSRTLGVLAGCVIFTIAIAAGGYVARPLRIAGASLAALFCALILMTLLSEFAR